MIDKTEQRVRQELYRHLLSDTSKAFQTFYFENMEKLDVSLNHQLQESIEKLNVSEITQCDENIIHECKKDKKESGKKTLKVNTFNHRGANKQRHLGCIKAQHKFRSPVELSLKQKEDMPMYNYAEKNTKFWENRVLSQLSTETRLFILDKDKLDGRNEGDAKIVDFK